MKRREQLAGAAALAGISRAHAFGIGKLGGRGARAIRAFSGSSAEAEKLAERHGYTKSQIAEVRRRCGL